MQCILLVFIPFSSPPAPCHPCPLPPSFPSFSYFYDPLSIFTAGQMGVGPPPGTLSGPTPQRKLTLPSFSSHQMSQGLRLGVGARVPLSTSMLDYCLAWSYASTHRFGEFIGAKCVRDMLCPSSSNLWHLDSFLPLFHVVSWALGGIVWYRYPLMAERAVDQPRVSVFTGPLHREAKD